MLNNKYKSISYIFTPQEKLELLTYEILNLFEISKRKLEWFVYGLVILIWLGVAYCFSALSELSNPHKTLNETVVLEVPKEQPISISHEVKYSKESVYKEILKVSKSKLTPEEIYSKVESASKEWNISKFFLLALLEKECNFKESSIARDYDKTGSVGWSQATKETWDWFNSQYVWKKYKTTYSYEDRFDPDKSLEFIGWYLTYLKSFKSVKTLEDLYTAYNGGPYGLHKASARKNAKDCIKLYNNYRNAYLNQIQ